MTIIGLCTGVFYVAEQTDPRKRRACFQRAERILRQTGHSVYLTPEGFRNANGNHLQKFNKGAFHLATNLKWPIVPLVIESPLECHPGMGFVANRGTVVIRELPAIDTSDWELQDLEKNRDEMRQVFLDVLSDSDNVKGSRYAKTWS